jgi:hypothetical protein
MAIYVVTGKIGAGKTLFGVEKAMRCFGYGGHVMSNILFLEEGCTKYLAYRGRSFDFERQFLHHDFEAEPDFMLKCKRGTVRFPTIVFIDEAHLFYPSGRSQTFDIQFDRINKFISQSRKFHIDIYCITQDESLLYHRFKTQAEHRFHCIDMRKKSFGILGTPPGAGLRWVEKDTKSDLVMREGETALDKRLFGCFNTFQKYDAFTRQLEASIPVHEPLPNQFREGAWSGALRRGRRFLFP